MKSLYFGALIGTMLLLLPACKGAKIKSSATAAAPEAGAEDGLAGETPASEDSNPNSQENKLSGAYIVATFVANGSDGNSILLGLVGMRDDVRLSEDKDRFISTWTLEQAASVKQAVKLRKSEDSTYDQIIEYRGTQDQFRKDAGEINISLEFSETLDDEIVSSSVKSRLSIVLP